MKKIYAALLLLLSFLYVSCALEEDVTTIDTSSQNKLGLKQMNFADFKNNANDYAYFNQVENSLKTQISSAKMAYDSVLKYYIDKEDITYIYSDSLRCYTMPIYREGKADTENLILRFGTNGDFAAMIISYKFTQADEENILNGIKVNIAPSVEVLVNTSKEPCFTWVRVVSFTSIPGQLEASQWAMVEVDCPPDSGDSGGGGGSAGGSGGGPYTGWFNSGPTTPGDYVSSGGGGSNYGSGTISNGTSTITFADVLTIPKLPLNHFIITLTATQKTYWYNTNNREITDYFKAYLMSNELSPESMGFAQWAVQFFIDNPTTTLDQFKNWFMGESEGQDGDYDDTYWESPNLTFPQQNLPSWSDFQTAFPKNANGTGMYGPDVYALVGGQPQAMRNGVLNDNNPNNNHNYDNACALRVSRALNYAGVTIPNIANQTFLGGDGKYYFLGASKLNHWMRITFGTNDGDPTTPYNPNHTKYTSTQGGLHGANFPSLLMGKKGIFSMLSSDSNWSSGHADALNNNGTCINNCHFDGPISRIDIWVLN